MEAQATEALTVLWMLTSFATLVALVLVLFMRLYLQFGGPEKPATAESLSAVLLFVALIVGAISVVVTPVILKRRIIKPPLAVTIGVLIIGIIPWVILIVSLSRASS